MHALPSICMSDLNFSFLLFLDKGFESREVLNVLPFPSVDRPAQPGCDLEIPPRKSMVLTQWLWGHQCLFSLTCNLAKMVYKTRKIRMPAFYAVVRSETDAEPGRVSPQERGATTTALCYLWGPHLRSPAFQASCSLWLGLSSTRQHSGIKRLMDTSGSFSEQSVGMYLYLL